MQDISTYNDNLGTAILLVGGAGAGKTSSALRLFPRTWVGIADPNFRSGLEYAKKLNKHTNIVGFDNFMLNDEGKPLQANLRYDRMVKKLDEAIADPKVDAICLDSVTFIEDILKAKICNAPTDAMVKMTGFEHWGSLLLSWKWLVTKCRLSGKKTVWTAHETKEKDESDQIFKYQIAVDGQIRAKFPALFSDVIRCEVAEANGKHTWNARCLSNVRQEHLKNTFGIEGVVTQDQMIETIQKALVR